MNHYVMSDYTTNDPFGWYDDNDPRLECKYAVETKCSLDGHNWVTRTETVEKQADTSWRKPASWSGWSIVDRCDTLTSLHAEALLADTLKPWSARAEVIKAERELCAAYPNGCWSNYVIEIPQEHDDHWAVVLTSAEAGELITVQADGAQYLVQNTTCDRVTVGSYVDYDFLNHCYKFTSKASEDSYALAS